MAQLFAREINLRCITWGFEKGPENPGEIVSKTKKRVPSFAGRNANTTIYAGQERGRYEGASDPA